MGCFCLFCFVDLLVCFFLSFLLLFVLLLFFVLFFLFFCFFVVFFFWGGGGPAIGVPVAALPTASLAKWLRRPLREREIPGSNPAGGGIFSGSSHTSDLKIGTPVATLPGAWRYRVSTGTGRPGVSIL